MTHVTGNWKHEADSSVALSSLPKVWLGSPLPELSYRTEALTNPSAPSSHQDVLLKVSPTDRLSHFRPNACRNSPGRDITSNDRFHFNVTMAMARRSFKGLGVLPRAPLWDDTMKRSINYDAGKSQFRVRQVCISPRYFKHRLCRIQAILLCACHLRLYCNW